jgi:hypothetical protein
MFRPSSTLPSFFSYVGKGLFATISGHAARHFTVSIICENIAIEFSRKRHQFATRSMAASINKNPAAAILHLGRRGISVIRYSSLRIGVKSSSPPRECTLPA